VNPPGAVARTVHKYRAAVRLADAGVPVPDTVFPFGREPPDDWEAVCGRPAVRKPAVGTNGAGVELVDDASAARHPGRLVQSYYGGNRDSNTDTRVYVVDGRVVAAMRRVAADGEWRANVALGGEVVNATETLPESLRRHSVRAANALGLDCAGVDIVRGRDGPVVIEVNATAGFKGLFEATGTSPAPHIAAAAIERAGSEVPLSAVEEIAGTLDDAVPDCKPRHEPDDDRPTIGYTAEVRVGGEGGTTTVVGKVDTGADRSAIDMDLAAEIGAGPVVDSAAIRVGTSTTRRPLVDVDLSVDGGWRETRVGLADRSGKRHPVLLGRDLLDGFRIDPRAAGAIEE